MSRYISLQSGSLWTGLGVTVVPAEHMRNPGEPKGRRCPLAGLPAMPGEDHPGGNPPAIVAYDENGN